MVVGKPISVIIGETIYKSGYIASAADLQDRVGNAVFHKAGELVWSSSIDSDKKLIWGKVGESSWGLVNNPANTAVSDSVHVFYKEHWRNLEKYFVD